MACDMLSPIIEKFIDKIDPDDPEYQKELIRPVEIKEDFKLMEQRKRVTIILKSRKFRKELENAIKRKWKNLNLSDSSASLLSVNYISEQLILAALPRSTPSAIGSVVGTNGITPINDLREGVSPYGRKERQIRCKLAALHRLMDMFSWCDVNKHYITARIDNQKDEFLIKPFGIFFHEVTASSFITIDSKGNIIDPGSTILSADHSNWHYHIAIHNSRPDLCCVVHLRTPAVINLSSSPQGLLPISSDALLLGNVEVLDNLSDEQNQTDQLDISTPTLVAALQSQVARALANQKTRVLLLPNHGAFVFGYCVEEVWSNLQRLQAAAEVQESLCKISQEDLYLPTEENRNALLSLWNLDEKDMINNCEIEFEAVMRHLDNCGYRTGYLYVCHDEEINGDVSHDPISKYPDVEIPAVCSSLWYSGAQYEEGALSDDDAPMRTRSLKRSVSATGGGTTSMTSSGISGTTSHWFNTPNIYKRHEDDATSGSPHYHTDQEHDLQQQPLSASISVQPSSRWISARTPDPVQVKTRPHHPVTPGAHIAIKPRHSLGTTASVASAPTTPAKSSTMSALVDSKEFKIKQQRVKEKYYQDTNTPGPQSCLLDGITKEEARNIREQGMSKYTGKSQGPLVTAASKGIVQRGHKDQVVVLENVFKHSNPFEQVTDDDLQKYRDEVNKKQHPELYPSQPEVVMNGDKELPDVEETVVVARKVDFEESKPTSKESPVHKTDTGGMSSDSDFPTDSVEKPPRQSGEVQTDASTGAPGHTTVTSEASGTEDTLEKSKSKEKKKKKMFKNPFKKKKKSGKESGAE